MKEEFDSKIFSAKLKQISDRIARYYITENIGTNHIADFFDNEIIDTYTFSTSNDILQHLMHSKIDYRKLSEKNLESKIQELIIGAISRDSDPFFSKKDLRYFSDEKMHQDLKIIDNTNYDRNNIIKQYTNHKLWEYEPTRFQSIIGDTLKFGSIKKSNFNNTFLIDFIDTDLFNSILKNPNLLKVMDWRNFELMLAKILESFEYEIELTRGTKDGGIDLFAIKKDSYFGAHKYLLQAKRWKNKVGVEPVRSLAFLHKDHGATKSCLATTSKFTKGAWNLSDKYKWQLELKDFDGILNWIQLASLKMNKK